MFNVSHSDEWILFAFARGRRVGVDVEKIRPQSADDELVGHYLAAGEVRRLRALPVGERVDAFFDCWTRKEAFLKARGDGLMGRLDSFEVSFGRNSRPEILRSDETEGTPTADWTVVPLRVAGGYAGALVVEGPCDELAGFQWTPDENLSPAKAASPN
jgi:4'-phosphopantetheinyl transferase